MHDDVLLLHGDLVFDLKVLQRLLNSNDSRMVISSTVPLPKKDFKAQLKENRIMYIGVDVFKNSVTAQPLYKLMHNDWEIWLHEIIKFCREGNISCYAENAFNKISDECTVFSCDVKDLLCMEIDNLADYEKAKAILCKIE